MNKSLSVKGTVWRWPGDGGWYFVTIDREVSAEIRAKYPKGFVKVNASIGRVVWETSLFPHRRDRTYLICVTKKVRKETGIMEGDRVTIKLALQ